MAGKVVTLKIATHNVGDRPKADILDDLFDLGAVVTSLQEMADQPQKEWRRRAGDHIEWFWPEHPKGEQASKNIDENPICWDRRKVHHLRSGSRKLTDPKHVGNAGPGGPVMHYKWLNWVLLLDLETRIRFNVANIHYVPSPNSDRDRAQLMREQVADTVDWAKRRSDPRVVIINGDTNCDFNAPEEKRFLEPLLRSGFISCWEVSGKHKGSFGRQQLDNVMLRRNRRARIVDVEVPDLGFDHKPVLADVRLTSD